MEIHTYRVNTGSSVSLKEDPMREYLRIENYSTEVAKVSLGLGIEDNALLLLSQGEVLELEEECTSEIQITTTTTLDVSILSSIIESV